MPGVCANAALDCRRTLRSMRRNGVRCSRTSRHDGALNSAASGPLHPSLSASCAPTWRGSPARRTRTGTSGGAWRETLPRGPPASRRRRFRGRLPCSLCRTCCESDTRLWGGYRRRRDLVRVVPLAAHPAKELVGVRRGPRRLPCLRCRRSRGSAGSRPRTLRPDSEPKRPRGPRRQAHEAECERTGEGGSDPPSRWYRPPALAAVQRASRGRSLPRRVCRVPVRKPGAAGRVRLVSRPFKPPVRRVPCH